MTRRIAAAAALLAAVAATAAGTARADGGAATPSDPSTAAALAGAIAPVASGSSTTLVPSSTAVESPDATALAPIWCWATAFWHQWGTWPYEQRVTDTTYWCAMLGKSITSRSPTVTGTGSLCATNWTAIALISGGVGYPWFTQQSSAGFACPTVIPWITLHENRWVDVNRTDTGGTSEVASG